MRTIVIACALLLLGACHTSRRVATAEESHTRVHAVRTLRLDSSALFAIVEIDSPRLTLPPDTARPRIALSGRRMRAAVARTAVAVEAAGCINSSAASSSASARQAQGAVAAPPAVAWWALALGAAALILLSWRGIRLRR